MHRAFLALTFTLVLLAGLVAGSTATSGAAAPSGAATSRATAPSTVGSPGGGDSYYPLQGNGGYDARHYTLSLRYEPTSQFLAGVEHIRAVATQNLTQFDLDLRHDMSVVKVLVNATVARSAQPAKYAHELVITPAHEVMRGRPFSVVVSYRGTVKSVTDPDGSPDGWIRTNDGAFVANEPQGSPSWFAVNNMPRDKATYTITMDVPRGYTVAGNGQYFRPKLTARRAVWHYNLTTPVSDYLVTATVGKFTMHSGRTARGVPYRIFVDPSEQARSGLVLRTLPKIIDFFSSRYGAYPFHQAGAIIDHAPDVGYALETATRPLFPGAPDELTLAHELAHQWFGDTVTCRYWRDIWINEGFAEFSDWMWDQHRGGMSMRQHLVQLLKRPASSSSFEPPPGNPGNAANIFANSVYDRGAMTLEALREKLGNAVFFRIMRGWVAAHRYATGTTPGFTRFASQVAHRDLSHFFTVWLYRHRKP